MHRASPNLVYKARPVGWSLFALLELETGTVVWNGKLVLNLVWLHTGGVTLDTLPTLFQKGYSVQGSIQARPVSLLLEVYVIYVSQPPTSTSPSFAYLSYHLRPSATSSSLWLEQPHTLQNAPPSSRGPGYPCDDLWLWGRWEWLFMWMPSGAGQSYLSPSNRIWRFIEKLEVLYVTAFHHVINNSSISRRFLKLPPDDLRAALWAPLPTMIDHTPASM